MPNGRDYEKIYELHPRRNLTEEEKKRLENERTESELKAAKRAANNANYLESYGQDAFARRYKHRIADEQLRKLGYEYNKNKKNKEKLNSLLERLPHYPKKHPRFLWGGKSRKRSSKSRATRRK
jgi:hypothetical protein